MAILWDITLARRKEKNIPRARLVDELNTMPPSIRARFVSASRTDLSKAEKTELQRIVFARLPYSEKLQFSARPEEVDGPSRESWVEINTHLGTNASSLPELVEELGRRRFGSRPKVGDSICGGGSIPFEAARIGCDAYGSDLNPVAALLTWAALNIVGGGPDVAAEVGRALQEVFAAVDRQVTEWGIEHNEQGWRADAFIYCAEVVDPESKWRVPLAPSWVIGRGSKTIARLKPDERNKRYDIEIVEGVREAQLEAAQQAGTAKDSRLCPPGGGQSTPIESLRRNLRMWENDDLAPRPSDVFQERLYCIRWVETYRDEQGREQTRRHYRAPTSADRAREDLVLRLLRERFAEWQRDGYIPSRRIESGYNTDQPIRERGWIYWHHLFTPRQLLLLGQMSKEIAERQLTKVQRIGCLLGLGRCTDWLSRLCRWDASPANEKTTQVFSNQALNTLANYGSRTLLSLDTTWFARINSSRVFASASVTVADARNVSELADLWITDPPYADAIKYEELTEYFIAWYERAHLRAVFPQWHADTRRALAVQGNDEAFRRAMVDCYRRIAELMPRNGLQVVMFTHQDAAVWADLAVILWAAGLRVTAAWCIATETDSALKQGNYVQGTVLMVLRKRTETEPAFLDEIAHEVESEVKRQLDSMMVLDDDSDPNFGDADYQLAAYAAALRVLTARPIEDIDPAREIARPRQRDEIRPVERLIRNAVKIACDHLVPRGFDAEVWRDLSPLERFYLKGLEVESHGEYRNGVYQELARGFGAPDYDDLLANTRANETRLKTAGEFGRRMLSGQGFATSLMRHALYAAHRTAEDEDTAGGLAWLHGEVPDYWSGNRDRLIRILEWLGALANAAPTAHWQTDSAAERLIAGALRNDHV